MSTGTSDVNGSAGANTSRMKSVISEEDGTVTVAPTSAFGESLPW